MNQMLEQWVKLVEGVKEEKNTGEDLEAFRIGLDVAHHAMAIEEIANAGGHRILVLGYYEREVKAMERIALALEAIAGAVSHSEKGDG